MNVHKQMYLFAVCMAFIFDILDIYTLLGNIDKRKGIIIDISPYDPISGSSLHLIHTSKEKEIEKRNVYILLAIFSKLHYVPMLIC